MRIDSNRLDLANRSNRFFPSLPISSCGLRLDARAIRVVRVTVALCPRLDLCVERICRRSISIDTWGLHLLVTV